MTHERMRSTVLTHEHRAIHHQRWSGDGRPLRERLSMPFSVSSMIVASYTSDCAPDSMRGHAGDCRICATIAVGTPTSVIKRSTASPRRPDADQLIQLRRKALRHRRARLINDERRLIQRQFRDLGREETRRLERPRGTRGMPKDERRSTSLIYQRSRESSPSRSTTLGPCVPPAVATSAPVVGKHGEIGSKGRGHRRLVSSRSGCAAHQHGARPCPD